MNPNLENGSELATKASSDSIILIIQGLGEIKSFKNQKRGGMGIRSDGTKYPMSWTPRDIKFWMERLTQSISSQLRYLWQTKGEGMQTGCCLHSLMQWSSRFDDSIQWIPEISIKVRPVKKGQEGAIVILKEI